MGSVDQWRRHTRDRHAIDPAELVVAGSLPALWARNWQRAPGQPILHDHDTAWVSAAEFEARTRARAGTLAAMGVGAGDRVLFSHESSLALVEWHVATLRLGAVAVPTNPGY